MYSGNGSLYVVLPPAGALVAPSRAAGRPVVVVAAAAVVPAAGAVGATGVGVGATVLALHGDAVVVAVVAVYEQCEELRWCVSTKVSLVGMLVRGLRM